MSEPTNILINKGATLIFARDDDKVHFNNLAPEECEKYTITENIVIPVISNPLQSVAFHGLALTVGNNPIIFRNWLRSLEKARGSDCNFARDVGVLLWDKGASAGSELGVYKLC